MAFWKRDKADQATLPQKKSASPLIRALEPRIMFDAAAAPTAIDLAHHNDAAAIKDPAVAEKSHVEAPAVALAAPAPAAIEAPVPAIENRHDIIFVDTSVANYQSLLTNLNSNTEVVLINPQQDGLKVIADTLADRHNIDAIHIISHGEEGKIQLGSDSVDSNYLASHADLLATIGAAMSENGDILLYGCKVGADGTGLDFVQSLAQATHADVAASTDNTGSANLGGNWILEAHSGQIEAGLFGDVTSLNNYDALLAAPTSENFDGVTVDGTGRSQGTTGAARIIDGWTFQLLNASGTLDSGSYVDITRLTGDTSLANNGSDKAAFLNGTYTGGTGTQAAGVFKATTGEEFKFVSITVENGGGADTYRLVGYRDGSAVSGATQNFTAPAYGSNTVVSVSGSQWDYVDEVRMVQQNGAADISIYIDDIVVTTAIPPNAVPVATTSGGTTAFTEGNNVTSTPVVVDSGITISDSDNSTLASGTVSITGNFQNGQDVLAFTNNPATMGNISGSYNSSTGVMSLSSAGATATLAQWQAAYRSITYTDSSDNPNTSNRTVSFVVNDGIANSTAGTKTVSVAAVNDTPIATTSGGTTAFTEGNNVTSTPVVIDSGITVSDLDSSTLSTASVSITANLHNAEDVLAFTNNPATMGNISGSYNSTTGVMSFSSAGATATLAQWQAALRSVTYTNSSDSPNTSNRTVSFVVNDGSTSSSTVTKTVSVTAVNDTPVDTTSGGTTAFTEGNNVTSTPVAVDSSFTVTDADNSTLASASVAITGNLQVAEDSLLFTNNPAIMGNISGSYNSATGVMTLTSSGATATVAQWQAALRSITYTNSSETPNTSNRTISFTTNDGTADGNTATKIVTVASVNDTPMATASGGTTAFTEGANVTSTPVVIDSSITVSDVDSTTFASATVAITANLQTAEDVLAFTNNPATMGNISGSYNSGTGILSLSSAGATATKAQWQAALRSVTYTNSSDNPNTSNRTISFVVNDGNSNSTATTKTLSVTAVNDTPVDTTSGGNTAFVQANNATSTPVAIDSGFTVTDADNSTLASATVAITGNFQNGEDELAFTNNPATMGNISASYNAATGVMTLTSAGATATTAQWQNALRSVTYTDNASVVNTSNRTISFTTNDGTADGNTSTKTVTVAATNQSPITTTSGGSTAFTEGANVTSTPVAIDSGLTLSDSDSSSLASATISITGNLQASEDVLAFTNNPAVMGNISGSFNSGTGVLTLSSAGATATLAQWQAALRSVAYTNSSDNPNTSNRTISFVVNDGNSDSNTATKTVSVAAANDTPVSTASGGNTAFTEGNNITSAPVVIDSGFTVADGDNSTLASATVAITGNFQSSEDVLAFTNNPATMGNINASYNSATGVMTLTSAGATATTAQWQNALRAVTYTNNSDTPTTSNRTISFTANDGTADGNTSTKTVAITSVDDTPVATASGGTTAATENIAVAVDTGITLTDVDSITLLHVTVSITGNFHTGEDVLAFTNNPATMGNISGSYASGTGILTLTSAGATATLAQWQTALRSVTYNNTADAPNTSNRTVSFVVNDGSTDSSATTKTVSVTAVNDAPVNSVPTTQTFPQDSNLVFNSGNGNLISVSDADSGGGVERVTLTATHGLLTLSGTTGLSFLVGSGTGDATMTFEGTLSNLNTALNGLTFSPTSGYNGPASLQITTDDLGLAGSGGNKTDTDTINLNVSPLNPVVTSVSSSNSNGAYKVGQTIAVTVNFDSVVNVDTTGGTPTLLLETGNTDRTASYVSGSGSTTLIFNYTVQAGDSSSDLDYQSTSALALNGGTIQNASSAAALLTLPTLGGVDSIAGQKAIVVDGIAPTATIIVADTALAAGETSLVTITFSEAVTGFTNTDLTVANGTLSAVSSADGGVTWTATLTPTTSITDTTNIITLDNTGVQDAAGNAGAGTTSSNNYTIDTLRPTATIVVADNALAAGETSLVTITFSEAVTGFTNADLTVANGTLSAVSSADGGITWTATLTPTASITDTTNVITLDNTGVQDAAGNTGTGTTDSNNYAIDTLRPTATIVVADTALAAGETSLVTITFSEAVANFDNNDLTIANGTLSNVVTSDGGITWTATLTPTANISDTTNVITFDSTGVVDGAGNVGAGPIYSNNYSIDTARPTATIVVADNVLAAGETSLVTITFSEAVTGFTNADLTVANGTLSAVSSNDGGITWTATFTPGAAVTVATNHITLANTGVADAAGNTGAGITDSNNYAIDTQPPSAVILVADTTLAAGETSLVTITFNEAVTGFTNADLTVANGTLSTVSSADGGITWTATFTPSAGISDATNVISLNNTGVQDLAGNAGSGSTDSNNYAIDTIAPTVTSVAVPINGVWTAGQALDFTVNVSEAVFVDTLGGTPRIAITLDTGGTVYANYLTGSGTNALTFRTLVATGQLDTNGISIGSAIDTNGGTIRDAIGNNALTTLNAIAPTTGVLVDAVAPTIASVSVPVATRYNGGDVLSFTVTTDEAVIVNTTGGIPRLALDIGGTTAYASYVAGSGSNTLVFQYAVQPGDNDSDGIAVSSLASHGGTLRDAVGNDMNLALNGVGTTSGVIVDTTAPAGSNIVRVSASSTNATSVKFTATFSEDVTGVDTADFAVATTGTAVGTVASVAQVDAHTYTITVNNISGLGSIGLNLNASGTGIVDLAGNAIAGGLTGEVYTIDRIAPRINSIQLVGSPAASAQSVDLKVTFSEAVTHVDASDFVLNTASAVKASITGVQKIDDHTYTVTVSGVSGDGALSLGLKFTSDITDLAGNPLIAGFTGGDSFTAHLPPVPIPPTVVLAPVTAAAVIESPIQSSAVAPLIVTAPDASQITTQTNTSPLTTVEAPAIVTAVAAPPSVLGSPSISGPAANSGTTNLDTSTPGAEPIGVMTATNTGNVGTGGVSRLANGTYTASGPVNGPVIERMTTGNETTLQGLPIVGRFDVQTGVPIYVPLPSTAISNDASQQLSVEVRMQDGRPLVSWLRFDPATGSLSGQAPKGFEGKLQIQVIVRDSKGNSVSNVIELQFNDRTTGDNATKATKDTRTKPGAQLMGKPALNDQFAHYNKNAHQTDALLAALSHLSVVPATTEKG